MHGAGGRGVTHPEGPKMGEETRMAKRKRRAFTPELEAGAGTRSGEDQVTRPCTLTI